MPALTVEQIKQIKEVVENFHLAFVVTHLDPSYVSQAKLDELKRNGFIDPKVTLHDFAADAYDFGRMVEAIEMAQAKKMSFADFRKWFAANPIPLTKVEKAALDSLRVSACNRIVALGNKLSTAITNQSYIYDAALEQRRREAIVSGIKHGIEDRVGISKIISEVRGEIGDYTRDFHMIVSTEINDAMQLGYGTSVFKKHGANARVAKIPRGDACEWCKKFYLDKDGKPKIFRLNEIFAATNFKKRREQWKPTLEGLHPHCACQTVYVPDGYEFDDDWTLVPVEEKDT